MFLTSVIITKWRGIGGCAQEPLYQPILSTRFCIERNTPLVDPVGAPILDHASTLPTNPS